MLILQSSINLHLIPGAQFISQFTPRGTGPVVLSNLLCSGGEDSLLDCTHNPLNHHSCGRFQNVGVYCLKPEEPTTHTTTLGLTDSGKLERHI